MCLQAAMSSCMKIDAVVAAGGIGQRAGIHPPKQYQKIGTRFVLEGAINRFLDLPSITSCVVVVTEEHRHLFRQLIQPRLKREVQLATGGSSRTDSVFAGLAALANSGSTHVLIHDGARPFVSRALITRIIEALQKAEGVVPITPVSDALWTVDKSRLKRIVTRDEKVLVQTPQAFRFDPIYRAYEARSGDAPDCAAIALQAGISIQWVQGERANVKITTREDLGIARNMSGQNFDVRTGQGVDIHPFEDGERVVLCGVEIPFSKQLVGHSDADVGLHAIVDAIYGALGIGDIGIWFPPNDDKWKDVNSDIFMSHAREQLETNRFRLTSLDCTFVCEEPKIGPYSEAMRNRVAALLGVEPNRINIKATTSEKMGFMGRREGIMALATATIVKNDTLFGM